MNNRNNGGPAFARGKDVWGEVQEGMSRRDYLAASALQGFCSNPAVFAANGMNGWSLVNATEQQLADYCYSLADHMIREGTE